MNAALLAEPVASPDGSVTLGGTDAILSSILDPAVQLALWRRRRPAVLDWVDTLEWDIIDDVDSRIGGPAFAPGIERLLRNAGYPQTTEGHALTAEIVRLVERFSRLMNCRSLRFRLEVIETDACRKFHVDYVKARLLLPLSGPGTQWIDLGDGETPPVRQLACGDVGIFKGRLSVEEPTILHRSPPIAASGETRLLLALDPADERSTTEYLP
ncbi:DUF1826 domain-containing protein [Novosphingobium mangrovi (ex Huang et al. 2023)]|uniref:DUF1826 domain-containing protein n=1 Tax=Novosphingobium mangrovi (ex Huang et al. 2023) TaxID=2976432 RepID=A0ABT2I504_9SPHN|nr:DUF1826 domain-containing protein [Novosphingobium mangrovi (ex Huang et al. 2023)]MCT2399899.1 DUF1826 domain-containing protein [Novosphingobium mangrovi (ex Huang et al. 2023)]